jgi:hypothetical protein
MIIRTVAIKASVTALMCALSGLATANDGGEHPSAALREINDEVLATMRGANALPIMLTSDALGVTLWDEHRRVVRPLRNTAGEPRSDSLNFNATYSK